MQQIDLKKITCTPNQSARLVALDIIPWALLWHQFNPDENTWHTVPATRMGAMVGHAPAWTLAEINAMIGPRFAKVDLWNEEKRREKAATDPNSYPVFFLHKCVVFKNAAEAAAEGLIYLLENQILNPVEANERYHDLFIKS